MSLGRILTGIFVIFLGIVFLLSNYGFLNSSIWFDIWRLWPIVLVIIGLSILAKSISPAARIIVDVIIVLIVLFGLTFSLSPRGDFASLFNPQYPSAETTEIDEQLSGSGNPLQTIIRTGAINLDISGSTSKFAFGTLESNFSSLNISRNSNASKDRMEIESTVKNGAIFRGKNKLNLSLKSELPMALQINSGALHGNLDLSALNLSSLLIKSGASSYDIKLGEKSSFNGEFNIGASSINLAVPQSVGLKITNQSGLSSNNFTSEGLEKSGETFTSDNYASASKKIELVFKAGASSITLDRI